MTSQDNDDKNHLIIKYRIYTTICLIVAFFVMGLTGGVVGPSFVHLEHVLKTDTQGLGLSFIGENLGYLTGSILCGCIFDVFNRELQLALACLLLGLSIGTAPWSPYIWVYCVIVTVQNLASGYLESCIQSYILRLWMGHRLKGAITQAINAVWLFGSFICPFIVLPFLSDLPVAEESNYEDFPHNINTSEIYNQTVERNMTYPSFNISENVTGNYVNVSDNANGANGNGENNIAYVRYAYLVVGLSDGMAAAMLLLAFYLNGTSLWSKSARIEVDVTTERIKNKTFWSKFKDNKLKLLFLFLIAIHVAVGMVPFYVVNVYISAFVIKGLQWDFKKGPLITSLYRGCNGIGGLIAIPVSLVLTHTKMLILNMSLAVLSFTVMIFVPYVKDVEVIMWICTAIAGIAVSTLYTSMLLWGSDYISVTATYGTLLVAASAAGSMAGAPLTGYLFQVYSPMWLVYISQASSVFILLLFIFIFVIGKQREKK